MFGPWSWLHFRLGIGPLLTGAIVLVIVALMTVTTVIDVRERRADARRSMEQTGLDFATIANSVLTDPLRSHDLDVAGEFAAALWAQRDTSYVKIFDAEGFLLVGPGEDQFPTGVRDTSAVQAVQNLHIVRRWTPDGLEVVAPVTSGANLIGAVHFGFDGARIEDETRQLTSNRIQQTLVFLAVGVLGSYVVVRYFVQPIRLLVKATERIASGNLAARVEDLRGREMNELGNSFNTMANELEEVVQTLKESRARIVGVEEGVRREIATHLHGPVQGRLLALRAQLDDLAKEDKLPPAAAERLGAVVNEMGLVIQRDIAVLSRRLYPAILRLGLVPSLESLSDQFELTLRLERDFDPQLSIGEKTDRNLVPEQTRLAAYRIAEEALTNIVKHAADSRVRVALQRPEAGWLELTIADDGPGFATDQLSLGLGLAAMQDYAEAAGGSCAVSSAAGRGTSVVARLPLPGPPAGNGA